MANESTQELESALEYEKSCQPRADLFYKNRYNDLKGMRLWRPDWETHKEMQKADIDVVIQSDGKNGWTNELKISEKFRTQPWEDVLIEVYEDFDKLRPGWGEKTAAEWHFFFHEHKWKQTTKISLNPTVIEEVDRDESFVRMVPTWVIRKMCSFCKMILTDKFKDMRENRINFMETRVDEETITLILSPTKVNGKVAYVSACACVPKPLFKSMFNIEIEEQQY